VVETLDAGTEGISHFLASVPSTIDQVLDKPPVSELLRAGAKRNSIEATLAAEIIRTSNKLTVGGNLREGQALDIAIQLIADYPNESLDDFCLCLRRGVKGAYQIDGKSDIFRFDVLVINNWMKAYLDQKCEALENALYKEKDTFKNNLVWKPEIVPNEKAKEYLKKWEHKVLDSKIDVDSRITAAPAQRRGSGYKDPHPPEYYVLKDRIRRTASEFYKDRHSFKKMSLFPVRDHDVFAESEEDAITIYELSINKH